MPSISADKIIFTTGVILLGRCDAIFTITADILQMFSGCYNTSGPKKDVQSSQFTITIKGDII